MEPILVLAHAEADGTLGKPALETLSAALAAGGEVTLGVVAQSLPPVLPLLPSVRMLAVTGEAFAHPRYATDAAAAEALCRKAGASLVLAPGTSRWARVLPGVAYRLGGRADTHATGLTFHEDAPAITRWFYRQRIEAVLARAGRPWIVLLDPGCRAPWSGPMGAAAIECVPVDPPDTRTTWERIEAPAADQQTIRPDANLLFVAGAGWTKKQADGAVHVPEAAALIQEFLQRSQASLGGSKSLVDVSGEGEAVLPFMTHMNQVGQTGSTPRHPKGLSTCCHGEEPHVVGWRFVAERRAVNLDPNCGWARGKADVLYVADAFAVVRELDRLLAG